MKTTNVKEAQADHGLEVRSEELALLQAAIVKKMGLGPVAGWTQRDFEQTAQQIEAETHQTLSVTTLKRLLGRVEFTGRPLLHTLNTLCRFVGKDSWAGLVRHLHPDPASTLSPPPPVAALAQSSQTSKRLLYVIGAMALVIVVLLTALITKPQPLHPLAALPLSGNLTAEGPAKDTLPAVYRFIYKGPRLDTANLNLAIFEAGAMDYVQPDKSGTAYLKHVFLSPGLYHCRVISDKVTVAATTVLVKWLGWYHVISQGAYHSQFFPNADLPKMGYDTTKPYYTSYKQVKDYHVSCDDLLLTGTFWAKPAHVARWDGLVSIKCKGRLGNFIVQLSQNKPAAQYFVQISEKRVPVRQGDTLYHRLLHDMAKQHRFAVSAKGGTFRFLLDGSQLFSTPYANPMGELYSVELGFKGMGEIADIRVANNPE